MENHTLLTDLVEEKLFQTQCLINNIDSKCSAQCIFGDTLLMAFVTGSMDIVLYTRKLSSSVSAIKRVPWFQSSHKQISTLCFDPSGSWILLATLDGSFYIIPAQSLYDQEHFYDKRWSVEDITSFPSISSNSPCSRPAAIVWWDTVWLGKSISVGIVGTEYGEVVQMNLETGQQETLTRVNGNIANVNICQEDSVVYLLITSQARQQWRLLLKKSGYSCLHRFKNDNPNDGTRSRLLGLKQLSVDKFALLRQKLSEKRNQNSDIINDPNVEPFVLNNDAQSICPDTFFILQFNRKGQQLYTCLHSASNHLTVHESKLSSIPSSIHKLHEFCPDVLLTRHLFFITDTTRQTIYVISGCLSETQMNTESEFNFESVVGILNFENNNEIVRALYRVNEVKSTSSNVVQIKDKKIELPVIDTCIIVTNNAAYEIVIRKPLTSVFINMVIKRNEFEKAGKLISAFGINGQQLWEYAGDIFLHNKEFTKAVACYKLSKSRLLKSVLKFASAGHTSELLGCLTHCLISPAIIELPIATRIHLSNLCVLAFIETTLRISSQKSKYMYKEFLYFLSSNTFYDELLVVNIAGQTCLWEVLHHLAAQRGLYKQILECLVKIIYPIIQYNPNDFHTLPYGLLICLSEENLMQAMLVNPDLARKHMTSICNSLENLQIFVLQRLVKLYDPTSPVIRPKVVDCKARHRTTSYSSQCSSMDLADTMDENDTLIEECIETFLLILLTLIKKKSHLNQNHIPTYDLQTLEMKKLQSKRDDISNVDFRRRPLSAGYSHVCLIRNGNVYTWGSSTRGCLGTGPSVLRYGAPQAICFFQTMALEVFSVSCGHCHSLAVTNNGVYAWGSSQFGQLGLGKILQCSTPELITSLSQEIIIDAVTGQYHSVALTSDGRVFTWGWGVHGQLGHGNTDQKVIPVLVNSLLGTVIRYISAGHAHTLALSVEGLVYAFGCNIFGQLGIGDNMKSSIPMRIRLPEKITLIVTGFFHSLAVSNSNKLYVWGASPQVLRLQAQAQKKTRILEQQDTMDNDKHHVFKDLKDQALEKSLHESTRKKRLEERMHMKDINVGLLEEPQTHLTPSLVDTSLVQGQIIQIATGCHHNALLTKNGSLYTWGRNLDGQIGNGTRTEVVIPTPLCYNPASIFAQVPPRHNSSYKQDENSSLADEKDIDSVEEFKKQSMNDERHEVNANPVIKSIGVFCGYDYSIAIQPGGTILAWGSNSRAQLGRIPAKENQESEEKLVLLKSSKRIVRLPHSYHVAVDIPSQVPNIPVPVISYRSYDVSSLVKLIRPLNIIEKSPGEMTLHYALEYFSGLYDHAKILEKCIELKNYQACSKIAALQNNICEAFSYQLESLSLLDSQLTSKEPESLNSSTKELSKTNVQKNTELFNRQVENNIIASVEDYAMRNRVKVSTSRSLNSLQTLEQELYPFDCEGGSEELCNELKYDEDDFLQVVDESMIPCSTSSSENLISDDDVKNMKKTDKRIFGFRKNNITNEAIKILKHFINEIEYESNTVKCQILQVAIDFWHERQLNMQSLENLFIEHLNTLLYSLGLILFCQETVAMESFNHVKKSSNSFKAIDLFSTGFSLRLCSMILQHIDQDQPLPEYMKLLSTLTADRYGPPLSDIPESEDNHNVEQMIESIVNMVPVEKNDPKSFIHLKNPDSVLLTREEDTMVFTCEHHFPLSSYQSEVIDNIETDLITSQAFILPCTVRYLKDLLCQTDKPQIVCPVCIAQTMGSLAKKTNE